MHAIWDSFEPQVMLLHFIGALVIVATTVVAALIVRRGFPVESTPLPSSEAYETIANLRDSKEEEDV